MQDRDGLFRSLSAQAALWNLSCRRRQGAISVAGIPLHIIRLRAKPRDDMVRVRLRSGAVNVLWWPGGRRWWITLRTPNGRRQAVVVPSWAVSGQFPPRSWWLGSARRYLDETYRAERAVQRRDRARREASARLRREDGSVGQG